MSGTAYRTQTRRLGDDREMANTETGRRDHGYWNHNTAYHRWILRVARHHRGDVLDVGCGDGLLIERLAPHSASVTGIEPHAPTLATARSRLTDVPNVTLIGTGFLAFEPGERRFDLIVFVASLHHMDLTVALRRARDLLRPGGDLLVVGLSANHSAWDWILSGLALPIIRIGSRLHGETYPADVPVATPRESLRDLRSAARRLLPGVRIRRGLYYRYLLRWTAPAH